MARGLFDDILFLMSSSYIRELDGVRGLAILLVLFHHFLTFPAGPFSETLNFIGRLGWTGVDLCFVLSGFLISRILIASRNKPHHYFKNFYFRRALRIFPVYYAYIFVYYLVVVKFGLGALEPSRMAEAEQALPWLLFYGTNLFIAMKGTFIVASLNALWTLAIEEHFYLVWPFIVKVLDTKKLFFACLLVIVLAVATRLIFLSNNVSGFIIHTFTICRIDDFAIGAIGAILINPSHLQFVKKYLNSAFYVSLLTLFSGCLLFKTVEAGSPWFQSVGYTVLGFFFLTFILKTLILDIGSNLRRVFRLNWLCGLGKYSYAIYIFQMPVLVAMKRIFPTTSLGMKIQNPYTLFLLSSISALIITIVLSVLSYHLYEKWFLKLKVFFETEAQKV